MTLKEECSTRTPSFLLAANLDDLVDSNYLIAWGKNYFITDITSVRNGLVRINARIDVLGTYANEIKAGTGYVVRSNEGDKYIPDSAVLTEIKRDIIAAPFTKGFTDNVVILATASTDSYPQTGI